MNVSSSQYDQLEAAYRDIETESLPRYKQKVVLGRSLLRNRKTSSGRLDSVGSIESLDRSVQNNHSHVSSADTLGHQSAERLKTTWNEIIERYSRPGIEDEGDIIDLESCRVIEDNGHLDSLSLSSNNVWSLESEESENEEIMVLDEDVFDNLIGSTTPTASKVVLERAFKSTSKLKSRKSRILELSEPAFLEIQTPSPEEIVSFDITEYHTPVTSSIAESSDNTTKSSPEILPRSLLQSKAGPQDYLDFICEQMENILTKDENQAVIHLDFEGG